MNSSPSVSVVIPLYNKAPYVERAIESVQSQSMQDFEVVVVNDGSTDEGASIVEKIEDPRIRLLHQANAGVSAARNRGIEESRSKLIAFLDADDEWVEEFLESIVRLTLDFPEAGVYACGYSICDASGAMRGSPTRGIPKGSWRGVVDDYFSASIGLIWTSAIAVRREVFGVVGMFAEGEPLGEDLDMWLRAAVKYPVAYCSKRLAIWHLGGAGHACSRVPPSRESMMRRRLRAIEEDPHLSALLKERVRNYVARHELSLALSNWLIWGDRRRALADLGEWRRRHGWNLRFLWALTKALLPRRSV